MKTSVRLRTAARATTAVLLTGVLLAGSAPALASSAGPGTPLDGSTAPAVLLTDESFTVTALDAAGNDVDGRLHVDAAGVASSGLRVHDARTANSRDDTIDLTLEIVSAPDGGQLTAQATPETGSGHEWSPDSPLLLSTSSTARLDWTFTQPGTYEVVTRAILNRSPDSPEADELSGELRLTIEVAEPVVNEAPSKPAGPSESSEPAEPSETPVETDAAPDAEALAESPALTVLDAGDVIYTPQVVDGVGEAALVHDGDRLDPSSTVLHVPKREAVWPGVSANGDPDLVALWEQVVSSTVLPWRTTGIARAFGRVPTPSNDLVFGISGERLEATDDATLSFISATHASNARFAVYEEGGFSEAAWHLWDNGGPRFPSALAEDHFVLGVLGEEAGVYCLTLGTTVAGVTAYDTLTFVMGDLPAGHDYVCEQVTDPGEEEPGGPGSGGPDLGENVLSTGEIRISPNIDTWSLGIEEIDAAGNAGPWRDPAETVLYVPVQDAAHPASRNTWWNFLYPQGGDLAYRTTGQPVSASNTVANDLAISFGNGGVPVPVDIQLRKTSTTATGGYFASYRTSARDADPDTSTLACYTHN